MRILLCNLWMFLEFYDKIKVKINATRIFNRELYELRGSILISSSTDCYQPAEGIFRITRKCIELLISKSSFHYNNQIQ
ncbi:MAG: hypothetical protein QXX95_05890 [Nitrososphaerales archaeon]